MNILMYNGQVYQVGEFSGDVTDTDQCLFLKMLKGSTISTSLPIWDLMMKNVYSLGAYQVQKDKFRLYIKYQNDSTGVDCKQYTGGEYIQSDFVASNESRPLRCE